MDEPWIMTVKGPHGVKGSVMPMLPLDEQPASLTLTHTNHRSSNHSQPSKPHANGASRSPPKDTMLNHYRSESRDSLRDGQAKHTPVCYHYIYNRFLLCDISCLHFFRFSFLVPTTRSCTSTTGGYERETRRAGLSWFEPRIYAQRVEGDARRSRERSRRCQGARTR